MSDLGVIVTGVVIGSASGIGGAVLGAWMTGRSQMADLKLDITAEHERGRRAELRRIYAAYMASVMELVGAIVNMKVYWLTLDDAGPEPLWDEADRALIKMTMTLSELRLVASPEVSERQKISAANSEAKFA